MKKLLLLAIFIIFISNIYSQKIDILKVEYTLIENEIKRYEDYKLLENSYITYFKLKNSLENKRLEIFEEEKNIRIEQIKIESNNEKFLESKNMFQASLNEYKKRYDLAKKSEDKISKFDMEELEYQVNYFQNKIENTDREEKYLVELSKKFEYLFPDNFLVKISQKEKILKESYSYLIEMLQKKIELYRGENRSSKDIEKLENEFKILKFEFNDKIKELNLEKLEKQKEVLNKSGDLEVLKKNITVKKRKIETLKAQNERGYVSRDEVFEEERDYIILNIQRIEIQNSIKILKLELD